MERLGFIMRDLLELRDEIDQIDSQIEMLRAKRPIHNYAIFKTWYP